MQPGEIALDEINKYVGYKSETLTVTLTETRGWLKKLVNEVKMIQRSIFPLRFYKYRRDTGHLYIYNKPNGSLKHEFKAQDIEYVKVSEATE